MYKLKKKIFNNYLLKMATRRRKRSCKYGKLKRRVKTKRGRRRRCKKRRSRRSRKSRRRSCKYGKLKTPKKTKKGGKRRCKKKSTNKYFKFANKHRKSVMKKLKEQGFEGRELVVKTAKELGKMYKSQS